MAEFEELAAKLESQLPKFFNFKIGKTGRHIQDRYDQEYEYSDIYDSHQVVGSSENAETINSFEKYLVKRFQSLQNCDNDQEGGGEMTKSDKCIVYLVYNK